MGNLKKFYINGDWVTPNSKIEFPVLNPANNSQVGSIILGNQVDVDNAVAAAKEAFKTYSKTTKEDRLELLNNLLKITKERFEELAQAITTEMGAPITMSREAQADAGIGHLEGFIEALKNSKDREILSNGDTILREPIGVCGLITPWNWPINQITLKVIPALAAGSTCVLKPSEHTPLSATLYAEMLHDAGFPKGAFNLLHGDGPTVGSAMSCHPDIQMMSFTGSTRAGTSVTKDSADTVKRVTLELGGKSPNLIFADCDLEERVSGSVLECFYNTGQSCDAPTRLLVERSCYDEVLKIAKSTAENQAVDEPTKEGEHLGPLFDKIQFDRVQNMIEVGLGEADLLVGGLGKPEGFEGGWYVKPTIFKDVSNDMRIAQEEIFGPVLSIIPYKTDEEAVSIANDSEYGLAAYVAGENTDKLMYFARNLNAGQIHLNYASGGADAPFGGFKKSGNGREKGEWGLDEFLEIKAIMG